MKRRQEHEALLSWLRKGQGSALVTGARGVGKTMLLRYLAAELDAADRPFVYLSCHGSPTLDDIAEAFGARTAVSGQFAGEREGEGPAGLTDMLSSAGADAVAPVLLLDDADDLTVEVMSDLMALSRPSSREETAIFVVLAGSPDLRARLEHAGDASRGQRIDLVVSLAPLRPQDLEPYIFHRLQIAGYEGPPIFAPEAIEQIADCADGNPQAINRICRAAMVIADGRSSGAISADMVRQVLPSGGGGRSPETARIPGSQHERPAPRVTVETGAVESAATTVASSRRTISSLSGIGDTAFAPAAPHEDVAKKGGGNGGSDGDLDTVLRPIEPLTPSGEDPTSRMAPDTQAMPGKGPRLSRSVAWTTLGILAAVGAVLLYLAGTGEMKDSLPVSKELPAPTTAEEKTSEAREKQEKTVDTPEASSIAAAPTTPSSTTPREAPPPIPEPTDADAAAAWETPLNKAVLLGSIDAVEAALAEGADINTSGKDGNTPLIIAARNGDENMVSYLIGRGADPSLKATIERTPLRTAQVARTERGPDDLAPEAGGPRAERAESEFATAAGNEEAARPETTDEDSGGNLGPPSLTSSTGKGGAGSGRPQTESDADVTPLIVAARGGHDGVVAILLSSGAEVNAADSHGTTPLIAAAEAGDKKSAELLLARGADSLAVNQGGQSAVDLARENNRWDLVHLISTHSATSPAETAAPQAETGTRQAKADPKPLKTETPPTSKQPRRETSHDRIRSEQIKANARARVTLVQRYLTALGYDPGPVDGVSGSKTQAAVRAFQKDQQTEVDGEITASLVNSLAAEADALEAKRLVAKDPTPKPVPESPNFFGSILSNLQKLRGLDFNSVENPAELLDYCRKNRETWVYDNGKGESIHCAKYVNRGNL